MPGSDSLMLVPEAASATAFSVGVEPSGVPAGRAAPAGRPGTIRRGAPRPAPATRRRPACRGRDGWTLAVDGIELDRERVRRRAADDCRRPIGTSGAPHSRYPDARAEVLVGGHLRRRRTGHRPVGRAGLDLARSIRSRPEIASGGCSTCAPECSREHVHGRNELRSVRFCVARAIPGSAVLRADVRISSGAPPRSCPAAARSRAAHSATDAVDRRREGTGGSSPPRPSKTVSDARVERIVAFDVAPGGAPSPERACARCRSREPARVRAHCCADQRAAWARRWEDADVVIEGDDELQRAVRVALYHLMASVGDTRRERAVGARGLTGHGYRGHVFWDADVFVLPFLAATHPESARAMLEYRFRRLPAALARARAPRACRARGSRGSRRRRAST